ncbi:MAG: peptidase M23, partial [Pseudomonadota bacterium]
KLLGVLQTIERAPTPLLLIHPTGPVGTARSGMMMSEVTPSLQRQAEELRSQLEELSALRELQEQAEERLRLGLAGIQEARVALRQAMSNRTALPMRISDDPVKVQILAESATSLETFAGSIGILPPQARSAASIPFSKTRGTLRLPVEGTILRRFNETDAAGLARPGLVIAARPLGLVTTPTNATVRYAGAFLDYGNVVILEPEAGYLLVIAGLNQVYGEIGEVKDAAAPVGLLGGQAAGAQEFLIEASQGGGTIAEETLYIELRHEGEAIDPLPWFAQTD